MTIAWRALLPMNETHVRIFRVEIYLLWTHNVYVYATEKYAYPLPNFFIFYKSPLQLQPYPYPLIDRTKKDYLSETGLPETQRLNLLLPLCAPRLALLWTSLLFKRRDGSRQPGGDKVPLHVVAPESDTPFVALCPPLEQSPLCAWAPL